MVQVILGVLTAGIITVVLWILYNRRKNERPDLEQYMRYSLDRELAVIKVELPELVKDDDVVIASDINFEAIVRNKDRISKALTECVYGIPSAIDIVKSAIHNILARDWPSMAEVTEAIDFTMPFLLEPMVKWEILIYRLLKRPDIKDRRVIDYLDSKYNISAERAQQDGKPGKRCFDFQMLDDIFEQEVIPEPITYNEALDICSTLLFMRYKGFGCVGTLLSLPIDGMNFGASGSNRYELEGRFYIPDRVTNSVWVQINAQWVHFSFIDFYKVGEMARIINQIVSYDTLGAMAEKRPYKVTDMYDGSRVTAIRPPAGESWACFIRKFVLNETTLEWLLDKPEVHNWRLVEQLITFLMKAEETTAFTGQQNTGKTTMLKASVGRVAAVNIRVLEMSFELALRELYPERNTLTVKPTDYVSASNLQDLLKKTDGWLSMVGEVAEDIVAARMIQFCLIASAFTLFSHHGKDDDGLINGLTNSLVASGEYKDHKVAKSTVLDAIKNNVHLNFKKEDDGSVIRYVEYISEIHKEDELTAYPEITELLGSARKAIKTEDPHALAQAMVAYTMLTREYYTRTTDRVSFTSRKIIKFNEETMTYEPSECYSEETFKRIVEKLQGQDRHDFLRFYLKNWKGIEYVPPKEFEGVSREVGESA